MLAGTAAATLLGLVFVALTLNPQAMADEQDAVVSAWSGQAYSNFLGVLLIFLVGLVPDLDARTLGLVIGVSAVLGLGRAAFRLQQLRQRPAGT